VTSRRVLAKGGVDHRPGLDATIPYLDGVYLAVNAIPDAYLVHDANDCGYHKAERVAANHDLFSDLLRWERMGRVVRTGLGSREYIMGSEDKLSKKVLQVCSRYKPALVVVAPSSIVAAIGRIDPAVLEDLRRKTGVPIVEIPSAGLWRDHVSGYFDTLEAVCTALSAGPSQPSTATWVVGHMMDRNEGDQTANVEEIRRLLGGLGLDPGPVLLDGTRFRDLCKLPAPASIIELAGSGRAAALLARRHGLSETKIEIPVGIAGTAAWLEQVAERLCGGKDAARAFVDRELADLVPRLQWLIPRRFVGRSALVFADRLLLAPLTRFLEELGCAVRAVGCLSSPAAGESTSSLGLSPERHRLVPTDLESLRALFEEMAREPDPPLLLGNTLVMQIAADLPIARVEIGFPSVTHHALTPRPFLGFAGVRTLVERALNAIASSELRQAW
jgi:nitrogenase molybdenum-iron protein alpha/beta subunit